MTASRTSLLAPLLGVSLIGLAVPGFAPNAAADPEAAAYCDTLSAALPGIDATYKELKKTADAEAAAADAPPEDEDEEAQDDAPKKAKPLADLDEATLLQREIELADRLSGSLNDLAHQTQEAGLKRIAKEASDTAGSFSGSLREKQDGGAPDAGPRSRPNEDAPDPAETPNIGMLGGLVHQNPTGTPGDDWYANLSYSSNKLRNEMNALNHLCQAVDLGQPDGSVAPGGRRAGA
ncbi:MAG: hypothetical protein ACRC20_04585 [Segniliparus sp.]|uniref:hypothetical protein n=1 Tax=Segniliparus sp. TaxID=2804064 RepID=UPI003F2F9AED